MEVTIGAASPNRPPRQPTPRPGPAPVPATGRAPGAAGTLQRPEAVERVTCPRIACQPGLIDPRRPMKKS